MCYHFGTFKGVARSRAGDVWEKKRWQRRTGARAGGRLSGNVRSKRVAGRRDCMVVGYLRKGIPAQTRWQQKRQMACCVCSFQSKLELPAT